MHALHVSFEELKRKFSRTPMRACAMRLAVLVGGPTSVVPGAEGFAVLVNIVEYDWGIEGTRLSIRCVFEALLPPALSGVAVREVRSSHFSYTTSHSIQSVHSIRSSDLIIIVLCNALCATYRTSY